MPIAVETLGQGALGQQPLGSGVLHDPPTVSVSSLGTVSSGGPDLTVEWTYSQQQGDPQTQYRVEILDDALSTTYFDSGWLLGDEESLDVDVDAEGVPHDSSDVTARVRVKAIGGQDEDTEPFVMDWGTPHCTITTPSDGATLESLDGLSVEWSFSDDDGANTQSAYRVRVILSGSGLVVHDSGWVQSTDTSYEVPTKLNDGSGYDVEVQLKNNHGIRSD